MKEEQLMILRMVEEGKISAEEAAALLDALFREEDQPGAKAVEATEAVKAAGATKVAEPKETVEPEEPGEPGEPGEPEEPVEPGEDEAGRMYEEIGERAAQIGVTFGEQLGAHMGRLGERLSRELSAQLAHLDKALRPLEKWKDITFRIEKIKDVDLGSGGLLRQEVVDEYTGEFAPGAELVRINLRTRNGQLTARSWEERGYKVIIRKKVVVESAGETPEELAEKAKKAVTYSFGDNYLEVRANESRVVPMVAVEVLVPDKHKYLLEMHTINGGIICRGLRLSQAYISTTNGGVNTEELSGAEMRAESVNGSVQLVDAAFNTVRITTTNGSIRWSGSTGKATLATTNGSITVNLTSPPVSGVGSRPGDDLDAEAKYNLTTTNGSIKVEIDAGMESLPVQFDAATSHGSIRPIGAWQITHEHKSIGSRTMSGRAGTGKGNGEKPLLLTARTTNGSIKLIRP
ncbi:MAG TPA: DUF4097 domain-containing protein [Firmicutes bacterium]|nr:DUF4097 domain-containing protein [Bacillota bacterium]